MTANASFESIICKIFLLDLANLIAAAQQIDDQQERYGNAQKPQ